MGSTLPVPTEGLFGILLTYSAIFFPHCSRQGQGHGQAQQPGKAPSHTATRVCAQH